MNKFFKIFAFLILIVSGIAFVITILLFLGKTSISFKIDTQILDHFGSFSGGLFGSLLTFSSTLFLIYSINKQQEEIDKLNEKEQKKEFESKLFQMLDLHLVKIKKIEFKYANTIYDYENEYNKVFEKIYIYYDKYLKKEISKTDLKNNYHYFVETNYLSFEKTSHNLHLIFNMFDDQNRIENYFDLLSLYLTKNEFTIVYFYSLYMKEILQEGTDINMGSVEDFYFNIFKYKDFAKNYVRDNYLNILLEKRSLF